MIKAPMLIFTNPNENYDILDLDDSVLDIYIIRPYLRVG